MSNGTRVVWGDPIGCVYTWIEPHQLAAHADRLLRVGRRVGAVLGSLTAAIALPEHQFDGAAAYAFRDRSRHQAGKADEGRVNLRGIAEALDAHTEVLRRYREGLTDVRRLAVERGLEVREQKVWPPTQRFAAVDSPEFAAWLDAWTAYRACFDRKAAVEEQRRGESRELVRAVVEFTGARPDLPDPGVDDADGPAGEGRDRQRSYAERALAVLDAHGDVTAAHAEVTRLRATHDEQMRKLNELVLGGAAEHDIRAQAGVVHETAHELRAARDFALEHETRLHQHLQGVIGASPA